ncbi:MAG: nascent polypeptide-associated complex protein [Candidatus Baldrarchaeia archaeon]
MIPRRMSPKMMKKLMKQMGIKIQEIPGVKEVVIRLSDSELIIKNPQVTLMKVSGQDLYQILGQTEKRVVEERKELEIPMEDIQLVAAQAGVTIDEAKKALEQTGGDLAQAILLLKSSKNTVK